MDIKLGSKWLRANCIYTVTSIGADGSNLTVEPESMRHQVPAPVTGESFHSCGIISMAPKTLTDNWQPLDRAEQANAVVKSWGVKPHVHPYPETPEKLIEVVANPQEVVTIGNCLSPKEDEGLITVHYPPQDDSWFKAHKFVWARCGHCNDCGESANNPIHHGINLIPVTPWSAVVRYQRRANPDVYPEFQGKVFECRIVEVLEVTRG